MRVLILLLMLVPGLAELGADTYPKNPGVDVLNYAFALELQDRDNRLTATATIDVLFRRGGETALRFDLINRDGATGQGMTVDSVSTEGVPLAHTHRDNVLA
ncbi:MAG: hypothetical protein OEW19_10585, partial [Acidobacteriota bacterium]|nr:hypothetical protein [Acidobacteriota bacterium]